MVAGGGEQYAARGSGRSWQLADDARVTSVPPVCAMQHAACTFLTPSLVSFSLALPSLPSTPALPAVQVNDRFRNDLLSYLAGGQRGLLSAVATRLTGSADLFEPRWDAGLPGGLAVGRRPAFGLNTVGLGPSTCAESAESPPPAAEA